MKKVIVTLAFKQVIDADCKPGFEYQVWEASYKEYLLKSQVYNPGGKCKTFTELKAQDGRANSLHYKSGFAAAGYISSLNKNIPGLNTTLMNAVEFSNYSFEVIESDIASKPAHVIAITYFTGQLMLHQIIGDHLVVSSFSEEKKQDPVSETFMIEMQPFLSINTWKHLE